MGQLSSLSRGDRPTTGFHNCNRVPGSCKSFSGQWSLFITDRVPSSWQKFCAICLQHVTRSTSDIRLMVVKSTSSLATGIYGRNGFISTQYLDDGSTLPITAGRFGHKRANIKFIAYCYMYFRYGARFFPVITRKCGNCNALQLEAARRRASHSPQDTIEVGRPICSCLIAFFSADTLW